MKKGVTLIEFLIAVAIIVILAITTLVVFNATTAEMPKLENSTTASGSWGDPTFHIVTLPDGTRCVWFKHSYAGGLSCKFQ